MSSTKNKSEVWNFFSRKGNGMCICNLCSKAYKTGGGKTNLKNHLMHKHTLCFNKALNLSKSNEPSSTKRIQEEDESQQGSRKKINKGQVIVVCLYL